MFNQSTSMPNRYKIIKINHKIGILFHHLPVFPYILREGLRAENDTVRVRLLLQRITPGAVVVARDVERIDKRRGQRVCLRAVAALVHARADEGGHNIERKGGILLLWFFLAFAGRDCFLLTVLIDALTLCRTADDHQIHAAGHGA